MTQVIKYGLQDVLGKYSDDPSHLICTTRCLRQIF